MSKANSSFQQNLEHPIKKAVSDYLQLELNSDPIKGVTSNCTFKFDFHKLDLDIIGEIYTCSFPLKPGHIRKIKSDILKLLTYESLLKNTVLKKYIVLTINQADVKNKEQDLTAAKIIAHHPINFSFFGKKSWLNETINQFNIQILYYVLSPEETVILNQTRSDQKNGNLSKMENN